MLTAAPKLSVTAEIFNGKWAGTVEASARDIASRIRLGRTIRAMRAPPITITCRCGEQASVPYGEQWECQSCGRRWDTGQIPAEEYWSIMREMRNARLVVIGAALLLSLTFGLLAAFVAEGLFLLLPALLAAWFVVYMPLWRRKLRRRARSLPSWELRSD